MRHKVSHVSPGGEKSGGSSLKNRLDVGVYLLLDELLDRGPVVDGRVCDKGIKGDPNRRIRDTVSVDVLASAHCVSNEGVSIGDRDWSSHREAVDLSPRRDIASVSYSEAATTKYSKHVSQA